MRLRRAAEARSGAVRRVPAGGGARAGRGARGRGRSDAVHRVLARGLSGGAAARDDARERRPDRDRDQGRTPFDRTPPCGWAATWWTSSRRCWPRSTLAIPAGATARALSAASIRPSANRSPLLGGRRAVPAERRRAAAATPSRARAAPPGGRRAGRSRVDGELGERGVERDQDLQRGLAGRGRRPGRAAHAAPAPRSASACSRPVSSAASRAWAAGSVERRGRARGRHELPCVGPQAVGDLLAGAVAEAGDERVAAADAVDAGVGGGEPVGVQRAVEHGEPGGQIVLAGAAQPPAAAPSPANGSPTSRTVALVVGTGEGSGSGRALRCRREAPYSAAFWRSQASRARVRARGAALGPDRPAADEVAAVGRTERPGQLELAEAEQRSDRGSRLGRSRARPLECCGTCGRVDGLRPAAATGPRS